MTTTAVTQMMRTAATVTDLGDNRFLIKWGRRSETIIRIEETACSACDGSGLDFTLGQVGTCNTCGGSGKR